VQNSQKNHLAPGMRLRLLQSLTAKHVTAVEMVNRVLHAADPAKFVFAFRANHVIAPALLFFHDQTALRAVCDLSFIFQVIEVNFHGVGQLCLTVLRFVIGETAPHAYLVIASGALSVVRVGSGEDTIGLLLEMQRKAIILIILDISIFVQKSIAVDLDNLFLQVIKVFLIPIDSEIGNIALALGLGALRTPPKVGVRIDEVVKQKFLVLKYVIC
jgi:hypothetical protein